MSVRTMAKVWELSVNKGNDLLTLLAIADFADDDGNAYPAVQTLADKCRMKSRNANVILAALRASGELEVRHNEGPHGTNRYRIVLPGLPLQNLTGVQKRAAVQERAPTPARTCPKPLHVLTDEPSVNHHEPPIRCDGFADFWKAYPKKVAKPQALKAWKKAKPSGQVLADLMTALEKQKVSADWLKDGGQFVPYPATWLNARRWEDEVQLGITPGRPAVAKPKPGEIRQRYGADERFDETLGWIPA